MAEVNRYLASMVGSNPMRHDNIASGGGSGNNGNDDAYKHLRISTGSSNSRSSSAANSPRPPSSSNSPHAPSPRQLQQPTTGPGSGKGIDVHPFSRGSVIEVKYVKRKKVHNEESRMSLDGVNYEGTGSVGYDATNWDDDDSISDWFNSSDDDDDSSNNDNSKDVNPNNNVYLADIIDRLPLNSNPQTFKYYIHYRSFNRRMDEWITMERIVSPPSVGNARVRALKRKEDRKERERILKESATAGLGRRDGKKNKLLEQEGMAFVDNGASSAVTSAALGGGAGSGPGRKRLRRAASTTGVDDSVDFNSGAAQGGITPSSSMGETPMEEPGRLTRRQRSVGVGGGTSTATSSTITSVSSGAPVTLAAEEHTAVDVVTTIAAQILDEHEGMDAAALKEHEEVTKVKNVGTLELGKYQMDTWYFSPLPKELMKDKGMIDVLYVDEFSLNFFIRKEELLRYQRKELMGIGGDRRHPPGNEIYRCGNLSMFEVDGFEERLYCQNLCYIAKLFLDHKTLYFDVDPFLFYVLCEVDERGYHPVGYYSKEKYSDVGYNLACILTFPSHQRKGYGRFLIAFSYELSKKEEKVGSPEKPMSDLGQQAYIPYWTSTIVDFLLNHSGDSKSMSIMDIAKKTSIMAEDIIFALNTLGILKFVNGVYFIYAARGQLEELAKVHPVKEPRVDPSKLHWTPYINDVKRDKFSISSKKPSVEAATSIIAH